MCDLNVFSGKQYKIKAIIFDGGYLEPLRKKPNEDNLYHYSINIKDFIKHLNSFEEITKIKITREGHAYVDNTDEILNALLAQRFLKSAKMPYLFFNTNQIDILEQHLVFGRESNKARIRFEIGRKLSWSLFFGSALVLLTLPFDFSYLLLNSLIVLGVLVGYFYSKIIIQYSLVKYSKPEFIHAEKSTIKKRVLRHGLNAGLYWKDYLLSYLQLYSYTYPITFAAGMRAGMEDNELICTKIRNS